MSTSSDTKEIVIFGQCRTSKDKDYIVSSLVGDEWLCLFNMYSALAHASNARWYDLWKYQRRQTI